MIKAARYLNVAPWELAAKSVVWMEWALTSQAAEAEAQAQVFEQRQQHGKSR